MDFLLSNVADLFGLKEESWGLFPDASTCRNFSTVTKLRYKAKEYLRDKIARWHDSKLFQRIEGRSFDVDWFVCFTGYDEVYQVRVGIEKSIRGKWISACYELMVILVEMVAVDEQGEFYK